VGFSYAGVPRRSDRHQIEAWTTLIVRYCRELTGRGLQASEVRWMHHRIPESDELDSFVGCSAEFNASSDEISFAAEAAKLPVDNADPFLNKLLVGYCENVLARRKARPGIIQTDVENALAALLPHGHTNVENVARRLSVSSRTLRRKLAAEGVTFAGILEDLRIALARRYLSERDLSISRIAWLLGYTEVILARVPALDRPCAARRSFPAATRGGASARQTAGSPLDHDPNRVERIMV
jgi:AraC-like DNA-binding protein